MLGFTMDSRFILNLIFLASVLTYHSRSTMGERSSYIIHMDKSMMPKAFTSQNNWYASTVRSLELHDPTSTSESRSSPQVIYTYENVIHGFSALLSPKELESLKTSPGFVSAYSDREVIHRTTYTPKFLKLNHISGIWPASNYGKDVVIGIVDSGVWPESRSFSDDGMNEIPAKWKGTCEDGQEFNKTMCNKKLIGARYFNKGLHAYYSSNLSFVPSMNSPRDSMGHGTHTASTSVGNYVDDVSYFGYAKGMASGIAPRARLAVYKVVWEEGSTASDVLAGIDQAVADGVDVISLSLGISVDIPLYQNPLAIGCFAAMEKGIIISQAGGNNGPYFGSVYDSAPWTLAVGAASTDRWFSGTLILGNGLTIRGWSTFPASAFIENMALSYNDSFSSCIISSSMIPSPYYSIIICKDIGDVSTQLSYVNYYSKYISAAIYISDETYFSASQFRWPGVVITSKDASAVINYARTNGSRASLKFQQTTFGSKPGPCVAEYSSRGPSRSYNGILKPDLIAPGSLVIAAWIPTNPVARIGYGSDLENDYNMISGTSMACPHVTGVAALLKSVHPEWTPAMIRSAMMTTANPLDNMGNAIRDQGRNFTIATPLAMGSGHVDPNRALDPGLVYDATSEDYVNLLCSMNYTASELLTIIRSKHYNCSSPSGDLNYPSFIALYPYTLSKKLVQTYQRILTNVGNGTTYHAKVIAPIGSTVTVTPKTLVFDQMYDKKGFTMTVEYESYMNGTITHGSLVWIENNGNHTVRSPIVISPVLK